MFPFSSMFKNNQIGFSPFQLQSQMMKHPMASGGSFPFNMVKQHPMMRGAGNSFPFNMMQQQASGANHSFPFNMMQQFPIMGGTNDSFPFNMMQPMGGNNNSFPFNMMQQQNPMSGANNSSSKMLSGFNTFPFNYDNQNVQEENPFSNSFFQPQGRQNSGNTQQQAPQFPQSLIRDPNGKFDLNKIGNGVQSALGLVGQMGPMMKMFSGFFR
ncbi:hypothetical protein H1D32_02080 [Anaerobacillus sp. CMMVII]|uniref:hypothetical protein n=1 Tax=Anaerobacillus sp. CMMVII TaxID=2755588 RepID=UPI0021B7E8A4|nr:hypothetical protein [Anaerobacillus sp. CMMVII]MCT8136640.1 hypothetical protein [Anaerobacillus sp. CMMVII]